MVHGLVVALLGLTAIAFVRRAPLWPISHYPMFSQPRTRADATALEVFVVGRAGESLLPREDATFFRDFDGVGVQAALSGIAKEQGPASEQSRRFLGLLLGALQEKALPGDVPIAVRLYRVVWRYPDAHDPRRQIAERTLLLETASSDAR